MSELAANNPTERAEAMIRLTERLTQLLNQETEFFNAKRPKEAIPFQAEKSKLASLYRLETAAAAKDRRRFAGISQALRTRLREKTQQFEAAVKQNGLAVTTLKTLSEGVVQALVTEAAKQKQAKAGYGPGAYQQAQLGAVAVNRTA